MLSELRGLSDADLAAIADLERRVLAHDGGRLKLEWTALRERSGERVDDLLWRDGDRLLGFLGLYSFGSADLELAGMVDPAVRRQGIGTALLNAAKPLGRDRGFAQALLVTPARPRPAGGLPTRSAPRSSIRNITSRSVRRRPKGRSIRP